VDLGGEIDTLKTLQTGLAQASTGLGFVLEDRPFAPHLTLARARQPRGDQGLAECVEPLQHRKLGEWEAREAVLFESRPGPQGMSHVALDRFLFRRG
jgi:2'-5' RNA ligase